MKAIRYISPLRLVPIYIVCNNQKYSKFHKNSFKTERGHYQFLCWFRLRIYNIYNTLNGFRCFLRYVANSWTKIKYVTLGKRQPFIKNLHGNIYVFFTEIRNMFLTVPSLQNVSRDMNLKFGFICQPVFFSIPIQLCQPLRSPRSHVRVGGWMGIPRGLHRNPKTSSSSMHRCRYGCCTLGRISPFSFCQPKITNN